MISLQSLPSLNAGLNSASAFFLITGYWFIRRGHRDAHRACMLGAFAASILFLISYLTYHYHAGSVPFTGQGWIRPVYFSILISHTVLAALVPFLAIRVLYLAWKERFNEHRRAARWAFPIWLYVSITGVTVYVFLYQL